MCASTLKREGELLKMLGRPGHSDSFARDNLPPVELWSDIKLGSLQYLIGCSAKNRVWKNPEVSFERRLTA